ncbi:2Fe-2S iron-sulfur cluster-binding protein [Neptuniibacter sp.]|uniref:2Fe-2S iron-sulfur cluster-binding protein n=1 Tax=Neptuniibacter sp. TaxID=1962643 RepID=UPI0026328828|nr:2Fe-2S iron-sulfur cluster-binding protein [Neptuniibacter sp.]MCP4596530.1 2Fe-2S iron-sulfur cluster binding domain-containing protein [Neptuniibacter sp.]
MNNGSEQSAEQYNIKVINRDSSFTCRSGDTLLRSMEQNQQHPIAVGCRGGGCGVCKVQILSGSYTAKVMSKAHISDAEKAEGYALACRVFPSSDLEVTACNPVNE